MNWPQVARASLRIARGDMGAALPMFWAVMRFPADIRYFAIKNIEHAVREFEFNRRAA